MDRLDASTVLREVEDAVEKLAEAPDNVVNAMAAASAAMTRFVAGISNDGSNSNRSVEKNKKLLVVNSGESLATMVREAQETWIELSFRIMREGDSPEAWLAVDLTHSVSLLGALVTYHDAVQRAHALADEDVATAADLTQVLCTLRELNCVARVFLAAVHLVPNTDSLVDMVREGSRDPVRFAGKGLENIKLGLIAMIMAFLRLSFSDKALFILNILELYDKYAPTLDRASLMVQILISGSDAFDNWSYRDIVVGQPTITWTSLGVGPEFIPSIRLRRGYILDTYVATKDTLLALTAYGVNALGRSVSNNMLSALSVVASSILSLPLYNFLIIVTSFRILSKLAKKGYEERLEKEKQEILQLQKNENMEIRRRLQIMERRYEAIRGGANVPEIEPAEAHPNAELLASLGIE